MDPEIRALSPRRKRVFRVLALGLALGLGVVVLEAGLRIVGGYRLFTVDLQVREPVADSSGGADLLVLAQQLAAGSGREDLDPQWMLQMPAVPQRGAVDSMMQEREELHRTCAVHYVFNAARVRAAQAQPGGIEALLGGVRPDWVTTFEPEDGKPVPSYRFPASATLPDGLTTNRFGWRGRDVSIEKPPGVVRIACVGASTTVSNHDQSWSWTQILEHWLNLWAQRAGRSLRYEVLNLGREGITSDDLEAIVRTEALPMAPDYILYMEGANQFAPDTVVQWDGGGAFGKPPAGLLQAAGGVARDSALLRAATWSALARRLAGMQSVPQQLAEPEKTAQRFVLPAGLVESAPDPALVRQHNVLGMRAVLDDLQRIDAQARAAGSQLLLATFPWLVHEGLALHPVRHAEIFNYLNSIHWPLNYAMLQRSAALQQAAFREWAGGRAVPLLDIAAGMPREPDLFIDGIHDNQFGSIARAWCFLEALTPILATDGPLPRDVRAPPLPPSLIQPPQRTALK